MIAEGSDWCWWYGDEHFTPIAGEFDRLFRENTAQVYRCAGLPVPGYLLTAIKRKGGSSAFSPQTDYLNEVVVDGTVTSYFEWLNSASFDAMLASSDMHRGWMTTRRIFFGASQQASIFLRIDPMEGQEENVHEYTEYIVRFLEPFPCEVVIGRKDSQTVITIKKGGLDKGFDLVATAQWKSIVEASIEISKDGKPWSDLARFMVVLINSSNGAILEQWPAGDLFAVNANKGDFGKDWIV